MHIKESVEVSKRVEKTKVTVKKIASMIVISLSSDSMRVVIW